jgi:hypothetical protein
VANIIRGEYAVVISDLHIPHQNPAAEAIVLAVCRDLKPSIVVQNGDQLDCPQISNHLKDPTQMNRFRRDRELLDHWNDRLKLASPGAKHYWLDGNHENRWKRYILTNASEISDLPELEPKNLFHHVQHGFEYHEYMEPIFPYGICVLHGNVARNISGATSRAMLSKWGCSGISGHAHRREQVMHRDYSGTSEWHVSGCLCDLNPKYTTNPNWNLGFNLIYYMKHYTQGHILPVAIIDGQAVVNGRGYEFEDGFAA